MATDLATRRQAARGGQLAKRQWGSLAATALLAAALLAWLATRKEYPEVTSPESLTLVRALYTACSSQSTARLDQVEQLLEECCREAKVSQAEEEAFRKIIAWARENRWKDAAEASYRFAQDQVR